TGSLTVGSPNDPAKIPGTLSWTIPSGLKVYWHETSPTGDRWIEVQPTMPFWSNTLINLAVEGVASGSGTLTAGFTPDEEFTANATAVADATLVGRVNIDLLI